MAIIPIFDPIEVEILVNNQPVTEYSDPDTDDNAFDQVERQVTKYIEAKTGATFTVRYKIATTVRLFHGDVDLVMCVYIDDKYMDAHVISRTSMQRDIVTTLTGHRYTAPNGQWFERSFSFNQLSIGG